MPQVTVISQLQRAHSGWKAEVFDPPDVLLRKMNNARTPIGVQARFLYLLYGVDVSEATVRNLHKSEPAQAA